MTHTLDSIDRKILAQLQSDSSLTNAQLAERVNLSATPCLRRVKRMEEENIIQGYSAQLNAKALGVGVSAFVFLKLEHHTSENAKIFENAVKELPQVTECCSISGEYDYVLRIMAKDLEGYEKFITEQMTSIEGILGASSTIILSQKITSGKLPLNL